MASRRTCRPFFCPTTPPIAISTVLGQPLAFLARYAHLLTLTCVWAHTFTQTPPSAASETGNKETLSVSPICLCWDQACYHWSVCKGLFLPVRIPSNWWGTVSEELMATFGRGAGSQHQLGQERQYPPMRVRSGKNLTDGCSSPNPQPPQYCLTPTLERAESKVTEGREGGGKKSHQVLPSPTCCPHSGLSDPWLMPEATLLPSSAPWSNTEKV